MNKKYLLVLLSFVLVSFSFIELTVTQLKVDKLNKCNPYHNKLAAGALKETCKLITKRTEGFGYEQQFKQEGLVNITDLDTTIKIDLKYSSPQNFTGKDIYGSLDKAYLQREAAEKLVKAQHLLKDKFPYYNIKVLDAARPLSVQKQLWEKLELPFFQKVNYLSNPSNKGSVHNYGVAVDLTIVDEQNIELDMGSAYDSFDSELSSKDNRSLLELGKLTYRQFDNRQLLRSIMCSVGFSPIATEWWHFNACSINTAQAKYKLL